MWCSSDATWTQATWYVVLLLQQMLKYISFYSCQRTRNICCQIYNGKYIFKKNWDIKKGFINILRKIFLMAYCYKTAGFKNNNPELNTH